MNLTISITIALVVSIVLFFICRLQLWGLGERKYGTIHRKLLSTKNVFFLRLGLSSLVATQINAKLIDRLVDFVAPAVLYKSGNIFRKNLISSRRAGNVGALLVYNGILGPGDFVIYSASKSALKRINNVKLANVKSTLVESVSKINFTGHSICCCDARYHTEYMLLNHFANFHEDINSTATVLLFTELPPCPSCHRVIISFLKKFEKIQLSVFYRKSSRPKIENRLRRLAAALERNGGRLVQIL